MPAVPDPEMMSDLPLGFCAANRLFRAPDRSPKPCVDAGHARPAFPKL